MSIDLYNLLTVITVVSGMLSSSIVTFWICWRCLKPHEPFIQEKIIEVAEQEDEPEEPDLRTQEERAQQNYTEIDEAL